MGPFEKYNINTIYTQFDDNENMIMDSLMRYAAEVESERPQENIINK